MVLDSGRGRCLHWPCLYFLHWDKAHGIMTSEKFPDVNMWSCLHWVGVLFCCCCCYSWLVLPTLVLATCGQCVGHEFQPTVRAILKVSRYSHRNRGWLEGNTDSVGGKSSEFSGLLTKDWVPMGWR